MRRLQFELFESKESLPRLAKVFVNRNLRMITVTVMNQSTAQSYHCTLEVRGYELDSYGHVNHANYLNYLEHARWKMLEQEGVTLALINAEKRWPVVSKIEVEYVKPALMGEILEVVSRCIEHSKASMTFEQTIYRRIVQANPAVQANPEAHATKDFTHATVIVRAKVFGVTINEVGRPTRHLELMEKLWQ